VANIGTLDWVEDPQIEPDAPADLPTTNPDGSRRDLGIEGVRFERLQRLVDHRGSLIEAVNADHPFWDEPIVHLEYVTIAPGLIKGWGVHKRSADRYVVADGPMRVVLHDGRVGSSTRGAFAQFHFSREAPGRLYIPPGVWHANHNYGTREVTFLVFPTQIYQHDAPDKYRVDPLSDAIRFDWTLRPG
jgi:dTDP-4-dehydrorhamnose 3,5-epimerase